MEYNVPKEITFNDGDMIVSSTDTKGYITYVNDIFCRIAGYKREELIGQPHNIIRHEDMPKAVFKLLWKQIQSGKTIYAFVKNKAKNGDYYWVKAYVKPIYKNGEIVQYTSYRKPVNNFAKEYMESLYKTLVEFEKTNSADACLELVGEYLGERGLSYEQFIDRLTIGKGVDIFNKIDGFKYKNAHIIFKAHILTEVKNGNLDVVVPKCTQCEFGKRLIELQHEPYTKTKEWALMVKNHEHVHSALEQYVQLAKAGAVPEALEQSVAEVHEDTVRIFDSLTHLVDTYRG